MKDKAVIVLLAVWLFASVTSADEGSAEWMEITTYSAGDGFIAYITLHDETSAMVRDSGDLKLEIYEKQYYPPEEKLLKEYQFSVKKEDFVDTVVGQGAFEHPVTIFVIGRIPYDEIRLGLESQTLDVRAYFQTNGGKTLKDKTTQYVS